MRLGIISDTHDDYAAIKAALDVFVRCECQWTLHLGDFERPDAMRRFFPQPPGMQFAWIHGGDRHDDFVELLTASEDVGGLSLSKPGSAFAQHEFAPGLLIGLCHSIYERVGDRTLISSWATDGHLTYVLYGHTHYFNLKFPTSSSKTVLLNPGGFRDPATKTVLVLDSETRKVEVYALHSGNFQHAVSIQLDNRTAEWFAGGPPLRERVRTCARARKEFWSNHDNSYLCSDLQGWIDICAFMNAATTL